MSDYRVSDYREGKRMSDYREGTRMWDDREVQRMWDEEQQLEKIISGQRYSSLSLGDIITGTLFIGFAAFVGMKAFHRAMAPPANGSRPLDARAMAERQAAAAEWRRNYEAEEAENDRRNEAEREAWWDRRMEECRAEPRARVAGSGFSRLFSSIAGSSSSLPAARETGSSRQTTTTTTRSNEGEVCSICQESMASSGNRVSEIDPCKHAFHFACVSSWASEHNSCPICRGNVKGMNFRG